MAVNEWWAEQRHQRYWLEITDREDLGADLHAPQVDGSGRPNWTYDLVRYVRPGDVVLHWHKNLVGFPALIGYSVVAGPLAEDTIVWQAHGTYGRERAAASPTPSWRMPIRGYTALVAPVGQDVLRDAEPLLRDVHANLARDNAGALYFPFVFSDKRPVRTAQGYMVKFPAELLTVLPGLDAVPTGQPSRPGDRVGATERPTRSGSSQTKRSARGAGYVADAVLRRALERHAVALATAFYQHEGWTVVDVGTKKSWDLELTHQRTGAMRHVEVKGSTLDATDVELTIAEVEHSRQGLPCDLFVVSSIGYGPDGRGEYNTFGGATRVWRDWSAADEHLRATRFRYRLPVHGCEHL